MAIQAVVSGKVYARETIKAYRKDVTAKLVSVTISKCYFCLLLDHEYSELTKYNLCDLNIVEHNTLADQLRSR